MKFFISLVAATQGFSILNGDPYDKNMFEKKFYGFVRHSSNPNYARLPKSEITQKRQITKEELDRMDNTVWNNGPYESQNDSVEAQNIAVEDQSTGNVPVVTETGMEPKSIPAAYICTGSERDTYAECSQWTSKCHLPAILSTCTKTCRQC